MSRPLQRRHSRTEHGFVLLLVLGVLVVLALLAGTIAVTVQRVRNDQLKADQQLQGELDMRSTQATALYLLGTQRITFAGLTVDNQLVLTPAEQALAKSGEDVISYAPVGNELRMDGRLYRGLGQAEFVLRSDSGRISINWTNPVVEAGWLDALGVSAMEAAKLRARLLDYQDPDTAHRPGGAEAPRYTAAGLLPPPNRPLITPLELRHVLGWGKALQGLDDEQLMDQVTVARWAQICINTAPVAVIAALPGVSKAQARRVVALRRARPFESLATVQDLLPTLPADNDLVSLYPGVSGTLALLRGKGGSGWTMHWTLTPFDNGGRPWRIDYEIRSPARHRRDHPPAVRPQTPLFSRPHSASS